MQLKGSNSIPSAEKRHRLVSGFPSHRKQRCFYHQTTLKFPHPDLAWPSLFCSETLWVSPRSRSWKQTPGVSLWLSLHTLCPLFIIAALMRLSMTVVGDVTDIYLHSRSLEQVSAGEHLGCFSLLSAVLCLMRQWALLFRCVSPLVLCPTGVELRVRNSSTPQSLCKSQIVFPKGCTGF